MYLISPIPESAFDPGFAKQIPNRFIYDNGLHLSETAIQIDTVGTKMRNTVVCALPDYCM